MSSPLPAKCSRYLDALVFAAKWRRNPDQNLAKSSQSPTLSAAYAVISCFPSLAPIRISLSSFSCSFLPNATLVFLGSSILCMILSYTSCKDLHLWRVNEATFVSRRTSLKTLSATRPVSGTSDLVSR
uniref:Uncharacterized protein n=1 Tax=Leersia perrieri TaxID=77586 RepID=A0A0D9XU86_9ORYZ